MIKQKEQYLNIHHKNLSQKTQPIQTSILNYSKTKRDLKSFQNNWEDVYGNTLKTAESLFSYENTLSNSYF